MSVNKTVVYDEPYESIWQRLMRKFLIPTSESKLLHSLKTLLSHHCKSDIEYKSAIVSNGFKINYIEITKKKSSASMNHPGYVASKKSEKTLVLMHGYASGLGFFYDNYDTFGEQFDRVLAVDWPGMGGSARFPVKGHTRRIADNSNEFCAYDPAPRRSVFLSLLSCLPLSARRFLPLNVQLSLSPSAHEVEIDRETNIGRSNFNRSVGFFIDSLELFREQVLGDDAPFVLAGHSLGGLLSAQYALKYPDAVSGLVLISPVGLNAQPEPSKLASFSELSWTYRLIKLLLNLNVTPQDLVRLAAWKGPGIISSAIDRRFGQRWPAQERDILADYLYHITVAPPCGEFALHSVLEAVVYKMDPSDATQATAREFSRRDNNNNKSDKNVTSTQPAFVLKAGIFAREPLFSSMARLSHFKKPILVLYGDNDWLRYPGVEQDVQRWQESTGVDTALAIVPNAGHHLYLDNPTSFHSEIYSWLKQKRLL